MTDSFVSTQDTARVQPGAFLTLHYRLSGATGDVVNTFGGKPSTLTLTLAILVAIFLVMPLFAVIPVSFTPKRFLSLPDGEWSLRHYRALIENPEWLQSAFTSISIGVVSALVATGIALLFCIGMWISQPRYRGLLTGIALLPMVAPPVRTTGRPFTRCGSRSSSTGPPPSAS